MSKKAAVLSAKDPAFTQALQALGYETIASEKVDCFISYEQEHADMQCLPVDHTVFVLNRCKRLRNALKTRCKVISCADDIGHDYPTNVALNAAVVGKNVICREASLDHRVHKYCIAHGYEIISVKQGYAKCSCAVVSDKAIITADKGIYHSLEESKIDVLLIEEGRVRLDGTNYGFIGGASGYDKDVNTLYFCGSIERHPDYPQIKSFCNDHGTRIVSLTDGELTDIGGIVFC